LASIEPISNDLILEKQLWWATFANHSSGWWTLDYPLAIGLSKRLNPQLPWVTSTLEIINAEPPLPPRENPVYSFEANRRLSEFYNARPTVTKNPAPPRVPQLADSTRLSSKEASPFRESESIVSNILYPDQALPFAHSHTSEELKDSKLPEGWDDASDLQDLDLDALAHSYDSHPRLVRGTGADFQFACDSTTVGFTVGFSKRTSPLQPSEADNKHIALLWPPPAPWTLSDDLRIRKPREGTFLITPLRVFEVNFSVSLSSPFSYLTSWL
jgi:hypothetical protein